MSPGKAGEAPQEGPVRAIRADEGPLASFRVCFARIMQPTPSLPRLLHVYRKYMYIYIYAHICMYICIDIHIHIAYIYMCVYIYILREPSEALLG